MNDVAIIGGGVIGTSIAYELTRYNLDVVLLEKHSELGLVQSMANSGIIHSGADPKDGTLKAILNVQGNKLMEEVCKELHVELTPVGGMICATSDEEKIKMQVEVENCVKRQIPFELLSGNDARKKEPFLNEDVIEVLFLPTTKVIYPTELIYAMEENIVQNKQKIEKLFNVSEINNMKDYFEIKSSTGKQIKAKTIINAAGIHGDEIYKKVCSNVNFELIPRKGEYFVTDNKTKLSKHVIYPVPGKKGKGVLLVPTTHKNYLIGPDANEITNKDQNDTTRENLMKIKEGVGKNVKEIPFDKVIRVFAGIRSTEKNRDFIIEESEIENFINVLGIDSPGLSSSIAIAHYVRNIVSKKNKLTEKVDYIKGRNSPVILKNLTFDQRNEKIKSNKKYGKIICRCEQVSEQEIINAINKGARTIKGVKLRARPLTGVCQGGFCETEVVRILSEQLNIPRDEVMYEDTPNILKSLKGEK